MYRQNLVVLAIFLSTVFLHAFVIPCKDNHKVSKHIINILNVVSKTHHGGYIGLVSKNGSRDIFDEILRYINRNLTCKVNVVNVDNEGFPVQLKQMKNQTIYFGFLKIMLIFTDTSDEISNILQTLKGSPFLQTRARMLVILNTPPKTKGLEQMFNICWNEKVLNIAVIFTEYNQQFMFTFNPFRNKNNFLENLTNNDPTQIFYNKYINIHGYNFKVLLLKYDDRSKIQRTMLPNGTYVYSGYEMSLLRCIVSKMNGTMELIPSAFMLKPGERNPWVQGNILNYSGAASKRRIITEQAIDIMNTEEMIQSQELQGVTESLYPHSNDNMRILIRRGEQIPYYVYLFLVFNYKVWYIFIGVLLIGTIGWAITGTALYSTNLNKFINLIRMVTGGSLPNSPTVSTERVFLIFWLFYSLIIITAFTSNLTTVLMGDRYYPNLDTLQDVDESGAIICAYGTQVKELQKAFNGTPKYNLFKRMMNMPDVYDHINNSLNNYTHLLLEFTKKHPIIVNTERAVMVTRMKVYKDLFHIVKESPMPNYMAFQVPAGSPLLDHMNSILRKIIESGLLRIWKQLHEHEDILTGYFTKPDDGASRTTQTNPLTVHHIQAALLVLGAGLMMSLAVFIIEVIQFKIKYRSNKSN